MVGNGVGAGDLKKATNILVDAKFWPIMYLTFPSFQHPPLPLDKTFSITEMHSLGAKNKMGTMAGTMVLCTQYRARVIIYCTIMAEA